MMAEIKTPITALPMNYMYITGPDGGGEQ